MNPFGVQFHGCERPEIPLEISGEFWNEFAITKNLSAAEKASASETTISTGVHVRTGQPVYIKSFSVIDRMEFKAQGLLYEVKVYEALRQLAAAVPHFINMIASYTYDEQSDPEFVDALNKNPSLLDLVRRNHEQSQVTFYPNDITRNRHTHHLMVTSRAPGVSIDEFFQQIHPVQTVISVLFQILFCLHCMQLMGFQHNDLHSRNIFVDLNPPCKQGLYVTEGVRFLVPLPVKISIYDFDLSSCAKCGLNPTIITADFCKKYGICNERNLRFDMYTIFKHLQNTPCGQIPEIKDFFLAALGTVPIPEKFVHRFCNPTAQNECEAFPFDQPESVRAPIELLMWFFQLYILP